MSSRPSNNPSPSNSPEPTPRRAASVIPEASNQTTTSSSDGRQHSVETPQPTAGPRSQSAPPNPVYTEQETHPTRPLIIITESPEPRSSPEPESASRQGRPLAARTASRNSSSQPPHRRSTTPYARPTSSSPRSRSQPRSAPTPTTTTAAMSSASSSPGNTSTAGATSSSSGNPSYQLPYAPFPYPMPANARGSGQGQQGSSGSGSGK
ncbi:hypothetical protein BU26DRAFT_566156 [Trematosphaeria pertusa]|uniref:Uncharacterized protein n=1 Tax=Trematosphaeria pertusa TaxID=390896 RepID=A0A6A6I9B2_9PLEO|nr:uncharacterized protein BU26DRAFT_566156 [Trematosphaeria pertusa]KAF2247164.1 hypothetical protein BU26DRAFT_566156 [Trematosphaeria pertusa]